MGDVRGRHLVALDELSELLERGGRLGDSPGCERVECSLVRRRRGALRRAQRRLVLVEHLPHGHGCGAADDAEGPYPAEVVGVDVFEPGACALADEQ